MNNDLDLTGLLGGTPRSPDPGFRFDVFARMAVRSQRRAARRRAGLYILGSAAVGLAFPAAQALGVTQAAAEPLLLAATALALAYAVAVLALEGPGALVTRSRRWLRVWV